MAISPIPFYGSPNAHNGAAASLRSIARASSNAIAFSQFRVSLTATPGTTIAYGSSRPGNPGIRSASEISGYRADPLRPGKGTRQSAAVCLIT
jgi:hypothetical protein